jgi:hypothetical protein
MKYFTDLFSPETYEAFSRSDRTITGFRRRQESWAARVNPGDRLICYMTRLSRWIGVLEVTERYHVNESPIFYPDNDPFVIRFRVKPLIWLPRDKTVPIHEPVLWDRLSFTSGVAHDSSKWTGKVRTSLNLITREDGELLESLLAGQVSGGTEYTINEERYRRLLAKTVRREDKAVLVSVPDDEDEEVTDSEPPSIRESARVQGMLARCGETMGFKIWIPKQDRPAVLQAWTPAPDSMVSHLPLNYDETTLQTIEQIDVLWLKGRSIVRAFEVEHTTAVYSGILRMADLLALQPNMDIRLHIVAPEERKTKVFSEIKRPVFSLLARGPLSECCSFISYDSLGELAEIEHLRHMKEHVLDEYAEEPE